MDYLKSNNVNALINKIKNDPNFSEDLQKPSKFSFGKIKTNSLGISFIENKPKFIKLLINHPLTLTEMMKSFNNSKFSLITTYAKKIIYTV